MCCDSAERLRHCNDLLPRPRVVCPPPSETAAPIGIHNSQELQTGDDIQARRDGLPYLVADYPVRAASREGLRR